MRKFLALKLSSLFIIIACSAMAQQNPPFKLSETSYGIYTSQTVAHETISDSSTITHAVVAGQTLLTQTDKIPAKIGVQFGSEYQLTGNGKDTVQLDIEWVYPHEVDDIAKHTKYTSIRYPIKLPANAINASSYSLDDNFEVIKGTWILNVYSDNKKIFSRKFHLY